MTNKRRKTKSLTPKKSLRTRLIESSPERPNNESQSSFANNDERSSQLKKRKSKRSSSKKVKTILTNYNLPDEVISSQRRTRSQMKIREKCSKPTAEETQVFSLSILLDSEEESLANVRRFYTEESNNNNNNNLKIEHSKKASIKTERFIRSTVQSNPFKRRKVQNKEDDERPGDKSTPKDTHDMTDIDSCVKKKLKLVINDCQIINNNAQSLNILNSSHFQEENFQLPTSSLCQEENVQCSTSSQCHEENIQYQTSSQCQEENVQHLTSVEISAPNLNKKEENNKQNSLLSETQKNSECSLFSYSDNESPFIELDEITLEELEPALDGISDQELKLKLKEKWSDLKKSQVNNESIDTSKGTNSSSDPSSGVNIPDENNKNDVNKNLCGTSLQAVVENFINTPQLKCERNVKALKNGLCAMWLSNNYVCHKQQCELTHNAYTLFVKKLKRYPSKFVVVLTASMMDDFLFVDIITAAFKVLSERKIPTTWVTFLVFFVFYVTEPSDCRFLKFWANAARYFCKLNNKYAGANGFASLLSIFTLAEKSEEWKIIEFVKLLKLPPIEIRVTFALLEPILRLDIPNEFLTEAIEMCIETQEDVVKVYLMIVPKLSIMTSPIHVVELLLHLTKTLEAMDERSFANNLKKRLQPRVEKFKIKVAEQIFPLTAVFQKEVANKVNDGNVQCVSGSVSDDEKKAEENLKLSNAEDNYFIPKKTFIKTIIKALSIKASVNPTQLKKAPKITDVRDNEVVNREAREDQINKIKQFFNNCQFDMLGKFLNELRQDVLMQAAEVFTKLLFQMKISLQQVVDLVKLMLYSCQSDHSATVISCVSITLILNLVRTSEWEKAYTLVALCEEKKVNLVRGMVFASNDLILITQFRIALLLIEVYMYKENYQQAFYLIKKYNLFSSNQSIWNLNWKEKDKCIRVKLLEEFLFHIVSKQMTKMAFDLFVLIRGEQGDLLSPIDLQKFINEILILLLNQDDEMAITLFDKVKNEAQLNKNTIRGIIITLVRHNQSLMAKSLLLSNNQNVYRPPDVSHKSISVTVSSFWLEEEIFIVFDVLFDQITSRYFFNKFKTGKHTEFEVSINVTRDEVPPSSPQAPLCLGLINPSYEHTYLRIDRVLQHQFTPPISLNITHDTLKLHSYSMQQHIFARQAANLGQ